MGKLLTIVVVFLAITGLSQKTYSLKGTVTEFFQKDSVKTVPFDYSIESYDQNFQPIYQKIYNPWEKDKFRFEKTIGSFRYVGEGVGNDSSFYTYYTDTLNLKSYIIEGESDTASIYQLEFNSDKKVIREKCSKGCTYIREYFYTGQLITKIHTIFNDSVESFDLYEYDANNRMVLNKYALTTEHDCIYNYIRYEYDDINRTKTSYYGNSDQPYYDEKIKTYFDKKGLQKKMEYENMVEGAVIKRYTVIYR